MDTIGVSSGIDTLLRMLAEEEFSTPDVVIKRVDDVPVDAGMLNISAKQDIIDRIINDVYNRQDIQTEMLVGLMMKNDKQTELLIDVTNLAAQIFLQISKSKMGTAFVGDEEEGTVTSSGSTSPSGGNVPGSSAPHVLGVV